MRTRIKKRSNNLLKQVTYMRDRPPEEMSWLERHYWKWFMSKIGLKKDCVEHIPEVGVSSTHCGVPRSLTSVLNRPRPPSPLHTTLHVLDPPVPNPPLGALGSLTNPDHRPPT